MDIFGPVAYILEHCGIYFSVFLFLKLIIDLVVMIVRHMEINRMTVASRGFGKTLLSASYNILLTSVITSLYNPQASGLAPDASKKVNHRVDIELYEVRDDAKKKEEHLYPVVNSTALGFLPFRYHLFNILTTLRIFLPISSQPLPLLESSEILSILGHPDLELEPFSPTCLDQCATPVFSFLSPVSSLSSTTVDPEPPIEHPNPQARLLNNSPPASPTTNVLINNAIAFSTVNLESEDEPLRPTDISRGNIHCCIAA